MEHYYFIQQKGTKKGPLKLYELRALTIYFDELVWRSDSDQWKKASEFEELRDILIIKPPPTPKEKKVNQLNKQFVSQTIKWLFFSYLITSFLVGFISFGIANSSWSSFKIKYPNIVNSGISSSNYRRYNNENTSTQSKKPDYMRIADSLIALNHPEIAQQGFPTVRLKDVDNGGRYPLFYPGQNNETMYGNRQGFWFRPFKAFGSTIYLTAEEQEDSNVLLGHLTLSSFVSLSFIFIAIGIIFYAIKRTK